MIIMLNALNVLMHMLRGTRDAIMPWRPTNVERDENSAPVVFACVSSIRALSSACQMLTNAGSVIQQHRGQERAGGGTSGFTCFIASPLAGQSCHIVCPTDFLSFFFSAKLEGKDQPK